MVCRTDLEHSMAKRPLRDDEACKAKHRHTSVDELCIRRKLRQTAPVLATLPRDTLQGTILRQCDVEQCSGELAASVYLQTVATCSQVSTGGPIANLVAECAKLNNRGA